MNHIVRLLLTAFLLTSFWGCTLKDREQTFQATLRQYERVVRWGDITDVNQYRKEPLLFSARDKARLKQIKVTAYKPKTVEQTSALSKTVIVSLRFYNELDAQENTLEDTQTWTFDEAKERWYISSPLPKF
jgi:hypothetical protein